MRKEITKAWRILEKYKDLAVTVPNDAKVQPSESWEEAEYGYSGQWVEAWLYVPDSD